MYPIIYCLPVSTSIKNDIRITITTYFYNFPKWLYLFCLYSVFIII